MKNFFSNFYGFRLTPEQNDNLYIKDVLKKIFLSASYPFDFIEDISSAVINGRVLDEDIYEKINYLYNNNALAKVSAIKFLEKWIEKKGDFLSVEDISEFENYHKLAKEEISTIKSKFLSKKYNTPQKIKEYLDCLVIGQDAAKKILSVSFYIHLIRIGYIEESSEMKLSNFPKPTLLISGSTGSGKTYMISLLCNFFNLPFIKIDCSSLVSSGYVGKNLGTYFKILNDKYSKSEAEKAIVFFDEFDKLSENNIGRSGSIGGVELQQEFLTLLEDKQIIVKESSENDGVINSENIMMVFGGSFAGIEKMIKNRVGGSEGYGALGFKKKEVTLDINYLKLMNSDDLIQFGIIPELVGRVGFIAVLDTLTKEELIEIIKKSKNNVLEQYQNYFKFNKDTVIIEEDVYELIAEEAMKKKTGARALNGVMMQLFRDILFDSVNDLHETFVITKDYFYKKINQ